MGTNRNLARLDMEEMRGRYRRTGCLLHYVLTSATESAREACALIRKDKDLNKQKIKQLTNRLSAVVCKYDKEMVHRYEDSTIIDYLDEQSELFSKHMAEQELHIRMAVDNFLLKHNVRHNKILSTLHLASATSSICCKLIEFCASDLRANFYNMNFGYQQECAYGVFQAVYNLADTILRQDKTTTMFDILNIPHLEDAILAYVRKAVNSKTVYQEILNESSIPQERIKEILNETA